MPASTTRPTIVITDTDSPIRWQMSIGDDEGVVLIVTGTDDPHDLISRLRDATDMAIVKDNREKKA